MQVEAARYRTCTTDPLRSPGVEAIQVHVLEGKYISQAVAEIKEELKSAKADVKANALLKMTYGRN